MKFEIVAGDPNSIVPALRELRRSEKIVYHTGFLASDRDRKSAGSRQNNQRAANVCLIARTAMGLSNRGAVHLTQRKLKEGVYEYIATGA